MQLASFVSRIGINSNDATWVAVEKPSITTSFAFLIAFEYLCRPLPLHYQFSSMALHYVDCLMGSPLSTSMLEASIGGRGMSST